MSHRRSAFRLGLMAVAMFGFGFALVPLYGMVCNALGLASVQVAKVATPATVIGDRFVTVRFDARVQADLPWEFVPERRSMKVRVGEWQDVNFRVRSLTDRTITAQAVPSVVPWTATPFFSKADCFCFRQQTLPGGESRELPLRFVITADLPEETRSLTISYAFMALP